MNTKQVKMKAVALFVLGLVASANADVPYFYWTGAANDGGKWSTAENWTNAVGECVAPAKNSGDANKSVFVFPGGSVSSNDWASSTVYKILFRGEGDTVVRGGKITFDTSEMINVDRSHVTIYNDVVDSWCSTGLNCNYGELVFAGSFVTRQDLTAAGSSATDGPEGKIRFLGGVLAESANGESKNLTLQLGAANDPGRTFAHHLESAVDVNKFTIGATYRWVDMTIDAGGQSWNEVQLIHGHMHAGAANVFAPNAVVIPNSTYTSEMAYWDLNGYDQSIDRIAGDYKDTTFVSESLATLKMDATDDGAFPGAFSGLLSLVWNPSGPYTFTASGVSTTEGSISVLGGTFALSGSGSFAKVRDLVVADGARFDVTSSAAGALGAVENIRLDGTLSVGSSDDGLFPKAKIVISENGKIAVSAGVTVTVAAIKIGGVYVDDDTYVGVGWIDGEGSVKVDSTILSANEFVWKNAADGQWDEGENWFGGNAPDGSKPQTIAVGGQDFTVTVPTGSAIGNRLTVGGHDQSGVATVSPAGTMTQAAGARVVIGKNGKVSVPVGATYAIPSDPTAAASDKIVEIVNGGAFEVAGGEFRADGFYGLFQIGDGGALNVSAGLFDICPHMNAPGVAASCVKIVPGGKIAVSGGVLAAHADNYNAHPLRMDGGELTVSGSGRFLLDSTQGRDLSNLIGGSGTIRLCGQALASFADNKAGTAVFPNITGDGRLTIEVSDQAAFCMTNVGTLVFGEQYYNSPDNNRTVLTFDSEADNHLGDACLFGVDGVHGASALMQIKRGRVLFGGRGLKLATRNAPQDTITSPRAILEMTGGSAIINGINADYNESYYAALVVGNSLPEDAKTSATAVYDASVELSGGTVSNLHGRVALGTGKARGCVVQSGGAFVSGSRAAAFFGAYDGEGRWEMTGGTATFNEAIYLGIGESLVPLLGQYATCNLGTHVVGTAAKGVLDIEAGTFETEGDIISGTDGNTGSITVGPAGVLKAKNLQMLNATADTLTVKVGTNGAGAICLSGGLDLAAGIKLKIEGAATYAGEPAKFDLVTCKDVSHPLTDLVIEGVIPEKMRLSRTPTRIRLVTDPKGFALIVR